MYTDAEIDKIIADTDALLQQIKFMLTNGTDEQKEEAMQMLESFANISKRG